MLVITLELENEAMEERARHLIAASMRTLAEAMRGDTKTVVVVTQLPAERGQVIADTVKVTRQQLNDVPRAPAEEAT